MKKTFKLAMLICVVLLSFIMMFAACDSQTLNAHTHEYGEWYTSQAATCTIDGVQERACECGEKETQTVAALGHTEVIDAAVAPTCTTTGLTQGKHCSVCNETLIVQEVVPASHEWKVEYGWDKGVHWQVCSVCENTSSQVAHTLGSDGYCTVCNNPIAGSDGVLYFPSSDGTYAEVADYVGTSERVVIAGEYEGLPVKHIGKNAFSSKAITSIYIPESIESIGSQAFTDNNSLQAVTFAENSQLTSIGDSAFRYCYSLTSITIPDGVTSIGDSAFRYCYSLTSITIPDGVTSIESQTFANCHKLTSIKIPDSVTSIGLDAFSGCDMLITKVNGVSYVENVIISAENTVSIEIREGTKLIAYCAFSQCTKLRSITIPDSVTSIDTHAFAGCNYLTSITIPDSVTNIGSWAFSGCDNLTSVTIPASVTSIGERAFQHCNITNINFGGKKAEWRAIFKDYAWDENTGNYTVYCTDGNIPKQ